MSIPPDDTSEQIEIEQAPLGRLMRRLEADGDAAGWSSTYGNLGLFIVYDHHVAVTADAFERTLASMGEPVRNARYTAHPMVASRIFLDAIAHHRAPGVRLDEPTLLRNFVLNVAFVDDADVPTEAGIKPGMLESLRAMLRQPGVLAFAARYEGWGSRSADADVWRRAFTGQSRIADEPDALEVRIVVAVDGRDQVHTCTRVRGETAELKLDTSLRGDISTSLRILMDCARNRLPGPDGFAARYPTLARLHGDARF